jgi:hypothetical protein
MLVYRRPPLRPHSVEGGCQVLNVGYSTSYPGTAGVPAEAVILHRYIRRGGDNNTYRFRGLYGDLVMVVWMECVATAGNPYYEIRSAVGTRADFRSCRSLHHFASPGGSSLRYAKSNESDACQTLDTLALMELNYGWTVHQNGTTPTLPGEYLARYSFWASMWRSNQSTESSRCYPQTAEMSTAIIDWTDAVYDGPDAEFHRSATLNTADSGINVNGTGVSLMTSPDGAMIASAAVRTLTERWSTGLRDGAIKEPEAVEVPKAVRKNPGCKKRVRLLDPD